MTGPAGGSRAAGPPAPGALEPPRTSRSAPGPGAGEGLLVDVEVERRPHRVSASFSVAASERVALFGPSGAGKTTILEAVAGLARPDRGTVVLNGRTLTAVPGRTQVPLAERRVGLLRQPPGLFPHLTVEENAFYGCAEVGPEERGLLSALGLDHHRRARPLALSGGQRQRAALARMLLGSFEVLLLDEPFAGLDAAVRGGVSRCLRERAEARRTPVVLVTHDLAEAQAFCHRLGVMDGGRILQMGHPHEVVARPASRRVAEMVGYRGFVPAAAVGAGGGLLCVHPQRVRLGEHPRAGVVLRGTLASVRPSGPGFEIDLVLPGGEVVSCAVPPDPAGGAALDPGSGRGEEAGPSLLQARGRRLSVTALDPARVSLKGDGMADDGTDGDD